ncbi:hypothetical protein SeMB42_g07734, partial [Synchytrium endobioticum]
MTISERLPHITVQPDFPIDINAVSKGQPSRSFWLSTYNNGGDRGDAIHGSITVRPDPSGTNESLRVLLDGGREFCGISLVDSSTLIMDNPDGSRTTLLPAAEQWKLPLKRVNSMNLSPQGDLLVIGGDNARLVIVDTQDPSIVHRDLK